MTSPVKTSQDLTTWMQHALTVIFAVTRPHKSSPVKMKAASVTYGTNLLRMRRSLSPKRQDSVARLIPLGTTAKQVKSFGGSWRKIFTLIVAGADGIGKLKACR